MSGSSEKCKGGCRIPGCVFCLVSPSPAVRQACCSVACSRTTLSTLLPPASGQPRNFWLFWRLMYQTPSKGWYPYTSLHGVLFQKTGGVVSSAVTNNYLRNTDVYLTLFELKRCVQILHIRFIHLLVVTFVLYCSDVLFINSQACSILICVGSLRSSIRM